MPLQSQSGATPISSNKRITKETCNCHVTLSLALRRGRATSRSHVSLSASRTEGTAVSLGAEEDHTLYKSRTGTGAKLHSVGEWVGKGCNGHSPWYRGNSCWWTIRFLLWQVTSLRKFFWNQVRFYNEPGVSEDAIIWHHLYKLTSLIYGDQVTNLSKGLNKCLSF